MGEQHMAFRVDATSQIGTGHFMRCLTLADALKQRGARTRFISRYLPEHLHGMLAARGHEFVLLDGTPNAAVMDDLAHSHWLGVSQAQDAADSLRALSDRAWDGIIVDHYALDVRWEAALRGITRRILVIDDIADRQHDCDMLLDQNYYADMDARYVGKVPEHCRLLLGSRYALLRDEFRQLHEHVGPRVGPVKRVLVFFGGIDNDNYTAHAIATLSNIGSRDLHVDVVVGAQHPCREQIESACAGYGFECHVQTSRMAELMAAADLAIGAGGSATWERCCLGLPTLTICTADNQRKQVADAASRGLLYAAELKGDVSLMFKRHVSVLMENVGLRQFISSNGMQAVDGRGALRVIGNLGFSGIEIRVAGSDDSRKLFEWRNHPTIRAVSRSAESLTWECHQQWLASVLASPDRLLLIGHRNGAPVGVVRFDILGDEAEVSIYLVPEGEVAGLGRDLLQSAEHWLASSRPGVSRIRANVLGSNLRSQRLFLNTGYQVESISYSKRLH